LNVTRPLLESGAVSELDIIRLEREIARTRGERDQARARISRLRAGIEEAQGMIKDIDLEQKDAWRTELTSTMGEIASLSEGSRALQDRVTHSEIKAPVDGTVKRLFVNTLGGVVMPGGEVVEIVPHDDELVVEAKIAPKDRAFLKPGQNAVVKLTAYEYAIYGGLEGTVEHISADTITEPNGQTYYLARVRTQQSGFGEDLPILPGMMAQVDILTGKRTVLTYILKPILRAKANAMRER
jgi:adhesin transport system membrane fusion protein